MNVARNSLHRALFAGRAPALALALLTAACQDLPTSNVPDADREARANNSNGSYVGQAPFYCTIYSYTSAPSASGGFPRDTIFFPNPELNEAGRTVRYDYRELLPNGRPKATTSCSVPYTEGALRRVDRHFGVRSGGGADQFVARHSAITIQGCVTDGICLLDPIIVGGGGSGGGGGGSGGTGPKPDECRIDMTGAGKGELSIMSGSKATVQSCPGGSGGGPGSTYDPDDYPPEGITDAEWQLLNPAEKELCKSSPIQCWHVMRAANFARDWAAMESAEGAHNGLQDALRHAMWNADMTKRMGAGSAQAWADAHEAYSTSPNETRMDLWNNQWGRWAGNNYDNIVEGVRFLRDTQKLCLGLDFPCAQG